MAAPSSPLGWQADLPLSPFWFHKYNKSPFTSSVGMLLTWPQKSLKPILSVLLSGYGSDPIVSEMWVLGSHWRESCQDELSAMQHPSKPELKTWTGRFEGITYSSSNYPRTEWSTLVGLDGYLQLASHDTPGSSPWQIPQTENSGLTKGVQGSTETWRSLSLHWSGPSNSILWNSVRVRSSWAK